MTTADLPHMAFNGPISLPKLPLPPTGALVALVLDAMEVGLSVSDCEDPEIAAALKHLRSTNGTMYRLKAGKVVSEACWPAVHRSLATVLTRPKWMLFHILPEDEVAMLLELGFAKQQAFSAELTDFPNTEGVLTRALLRTLIVPIAALLGRCACHFPSSSILSELDPWNPRVGLGEVLDKMRKAAHPRLTRTTLCERIALTTGVWDRLRRGVVPSQAEFNFRKFVELVVADEMEQTVVEDSLRRAFVATRLVQNLRRDINVGPDAEDFWSDCARECGRIAQAAIKAARRQPSLPRLRDLYPVLAEGASGHWWQVWHDLIHGQPPSYFDLACVAALSWANAPSLPTALPPADMALATLVEQVRAGTQIGTRLLGTIKAPEPAREPREAAFKASPDQWLPRLALARFEATEGNPHRALELLADTTLVSAHEYYPVLGEALLRLGQPRDALEAFEKAIERSDSVPKACAAAVRCCRALGDEKGARRYEKLLRNLSETKGSPI